MSSNSFENKPNWFVRVLVILLCLFIGIIIYFNFRYTIPPAQISSGVIILIAFLIILTLSEAFDNFSIIKIISLSRRVKEKEADNKGLQYENQELRNQILNISTNFSQKQVNSTYFLTDEIAKLLTVKVADDQEKLKETADSADEKRSTRRIVPNAKFQEIALHKFLKGEELSQFPIVRGAKLVSKSQKIDPISERSPIFDGYIKSDEIEIFIEIKILGPWFTLRDRLYIMLSKIHYYRSIKKNASFLYLVLVYRPEESEEIRKKDMIFIERLHEEFEPAIMNGLLKVRTIELTKEEFETPS